MQSARMSANEELLKFASAEFVEGGAQRTVTHVMESRINLQERRGFATRHLEDVPIANQIGDAQVGETVLTGSVKFPGTAQSQVFLGDPESVIRRHHRLQPRPSFLRRGMSNKQTIGFVRAPPYSSAQLVQLRQTKPMSVLNENHRHIPDVDAHLDDRGSREDVYLAVGKSSHDGLPFGHAHAAMNKPHYEVGEYLPLKSLRHLHGGLNVVQLLGFLDQRTHDIRLSSLPYLLANKLVGFFALSILQPARGDLLASWRQFVDH